MIAKNISAAKSKLSYLVNSALHGKDVVLCKDGVPVVRLVPLHPLSGDDPCRVISELVVSCEDEALKPLAPNDWGELT